MKGRVLLLAGIMAATPLQAFAGFEFGGGTSGQAITISNYPNTPSYTPPAQPGEPEPLKKASRPQSDPSAPALQVFNERYIPDSVKNKYKLTNSWYGDGMSAPGGLPQSDLAPPPPEPFIVDDQPAATAAAQPYSTAAVKPYEKLESWRARKGEPVREILKRWSARQETELMWASPDDPVLEKDFSYVGTLENAVAALIRVTGKDLYTQYRSDGLTPVMMSPASTITNTMPPAETASTTPGGVPLNLFTPKPEGKGLETRWFALTGASLADVLEVWAEDEGATLVWQAGTNYALKDSVSQVGHFEDAVFKALSQFDNDEVRPVGQLYADPATGQKVLLIRTDTAS